MEIVAKVNGRPISRKELDSTMQVYAQQVHHKNPDQLSVDQFQGVYEMALEKLIARALIFQAALAAGIVAGEAEVEEEKNKLIGNFASAEEFYANLDKAGMSPEFYHRMVREDLTVNLMTAEKMNELPEPQAQEIEEIYRRYPQKMIDPEKVRARHILIAAQGDERSLARERIEKIRQEANAATFERLARENSDCPSAQAGGDLGYFTRGQMVESFETAAFSQPVGEVGAVVETPYGYHLILVLDKTEQRPLSLEEAQGRLRNFLKEEAGVKLLENWVGELRAQADIEILA
ncbi:peptidylprolyl isomerase [Geoalkalibacter halelectricus]|uniref:Peptidylprolyl isomerase n=1 Tax=Geoalkalibacter halelectricus TaxID=2847045 RepID=A0ABY5ZHB3_9BACT|nr:peptidylprolyl isomerase [Geoalkalibacter halelectricus]MDO3379646.1 peptidylprolyl isomerase [Geoalkalibacter halelectricus]UWZ78538.1 peptidylprolyl isomerase [Geoalkalibacter halelectricus]